MIPRLIIIFLLIAAFVAGCSTKPISPLPQYHGQSKQAVISKLGAPDHVEQFSMKDAVGEFRVELYNTYSPSDPANAEIPIEELWWDDNTHWITLWFHQVEGEWVVLNSCRWRKDLNF